MEFIVYQVHPELSLKWDIIAVSLVALFLLCSKVVLEHWILEPFCQEYFIRGLKDSGGKNEKEDKTTLEKAKEKSLKFRSTAFRIYMYIIICIPGVLSALYSDWFFDSSLWFKEYPNVKLSNINRYHYLIDAGVYLFQLLSINSEKKQKDYLMMLSHHLITLTLISCSYFFNLTRIGEVVMLTHDICDPWMELAKLMNYLNKQKIRDVCFAIFALTFVILRGVIFPVYVIGGIIEHCYYPDGTRPATTYECLACLSILAVFNYIWIYMIYKAATRPVLDDVRDDDD
ncbi:LAG1-domain-containing protein [Neoconidiobolus thromboides FSU 785]|nr:LAG1-domain-containing protein [Neoconidiobolus thromboides FSU 785]